MTFLLTIAYIFIGIGVLIQAWSNAYGFWSHVGAVLLGIFWLPMWLIAIGRALI